MDLMGDLVLDRTTYHCFILVLFLLFPFQPQVCSDFVDVFQTVFLSLSDFIGEGPFAGCEVKSAMTLMLISSRNLVAVG